MKRFTFGLVLAAFVASCCLSWAMISLTLNIRDAGRVLPAFSNLVILLRPLLVILPALAIGTYFWLWFRHQENFRSWLSSLPL